MHQLFFPPRLEVVVQQQQSDCLPANGGNELSFDRFFRDQPHRPPRKPVGWIGTDHRYDLLALRGIQGRLRAGAGRVDQRTLQPAMMIYAPMLRTACAVTPTARATVGGDCPSCSNNNVRAR